MVERLDRLAALARKDSMRGMRALIAALHDDHKLRTEASERLVGFDAMERAGRLGSCWISRTMRDTLRTALAAVNTEPRVPAGDSHV